MSSIDSTYAGLPVVSGKDYIITVGSGSAYLSGSFSLKCDAQPLTATNTDCTKAQALTLGVTQIDSRDSAALTSINGIGRSQWFSYTATCNGYTLAKSQAHCAVGNPVAYFGNLKTGTCEFDTYNQRSFSVGRDYDLLFIEQGKTYFLEAGVSSSRALGGSFEVSFNILCGRTSSSLPLISISLPMSHDNSRLHRHEWNHPSWCPWWTSYSRHSSPWSWHARVGLASGSHL